MSQARRTGAAAAARRPPAARRAPADTMPGGGEDDGRRGDIPDPGDTPTPTASRRGGTGAPGGAGEPGAAGAGVGTGASGAGASGDLRAVGASGETAAGGGDHDERAERARADAQAVVRRAAARRRRPPEDGAGRAGHAVDAAGAAGGTGAAAGNAGGDTAQEQPATRGLLLVGPGVSFGVQVVRRFAREGFVTAVVSRSSDTVTRVCGELDADGTPVLGAVADVTDPQSFAAAVSRLALAMGGLTAVVYNAKLSIRSNALTVAADTLNQTLAVNVTGALTAVQVALPLLVGRPGATILLTTAGMRTEPPAGRFALAVGKAGLAALGGSLTAPLQAQGVRLRTVVLDGRVGPDGPLQPEAVADHFWHAYAAPRGVTFRLAPGDAKAPDQLPFAGSS